MVTIISSRCGRLIEQVFRDDTRRMSSTEERLSLLESRCLAVLDCYAVREAAAKAAEAEFSGWLDRVCDVPGIEFSELTGIHGHLIALGLIRFEFTGRSVGLQYQLSPLGRDAVARRQLHHCDEVRSLEPAA